MRYTVHFAQCDGCGASQEGETQLDLEATLRREGWTRPRLPSGRGHRPGRKVPRDLCHECSTATQPTPIELARR